ncbi:MAG: AI-2E family transporter [Methylococcales bacterium]|nr:AI-2E family transporter [Methylococcales bacterium]
MAKNSLTRYERHASLAALALLLIACFQILAPFLFDLIWAAILASVSWPLYQRLRCFGLSASAAALLMVTPIGIILLLPFAAAAWTLGDEMGNLLAWLQGQPTLPGPPDWLVQIPYLGDDLVQGWRAFTEDTTRLITAVRPYIVSGSRWLLQRGLSFLTEVLLMGLSLIVLFFFYRDGEPMSRHFVLVVEKLAGEQTQRILAVISSSLRAVVYGILGTALIQALVAVVGLIIAGVPYPFILGVMSFFLTIIPSAMNVLWIPIALWFLLTGETGWAIFIAVWFVVLVGTIDNWLRPILISREIELPFILIMLGIFGGLLAYGFIGLFLGPTLLATGFALLSDWIIRKEQEAPSNMP